MHAWLRLSGMRFRCMPMYAPAEELDPLAQLFLKVLHHDRDIRKLVKAFDLTARVVEDVLGDLIRRNRATLVVTKAGHEIRPLDDAIPNVSLEAGDPLEVWQDNATGLVLPAYLVDRFDRRDDRADAAVYSLSEGTKLVERFDDAPDAQLIEMLVRGDEELRQREESYGTLDRLVDRFQVRPQLVWLRVIEAQLSSFTVPQIVADTIPPWIIRVWSVALRIDRLRVAADGDSPGSLHALPDREVLAIVEGWRATARVQEWVSAVSRFLGIRPAPTSGYELRGVRDRHAALADYFGSVGKVDVAAEIRTDGSVAWISPVLDAGREWLVVVLARAGEVDALIEMLRQRVARDDRIPNEVQVIVPTDFHKPDQDSKLRAALGVTRTGNVIARGWPAGNASLALCEAGKASIQFLPSAIPVEFEGEKVVGELLAVLQNLPSPLTAAKVQPPGDVLRNLRMRRPTTPAADLARLGDGEEAPTIGVVTNSVRGFVGLLLNAIVDPVGVHRLQAAPDVDPQITASWVFNPHAAFEEQLPVLSVRLEELSAALMAPLRSPWAFWRRLTSYDLLATIVAALSYPAARPVSGEITIVGGGIGELGFSDALLDLMKTAVMKHGWTVRVGFPSAALRDAGQMERLKVLREKVPDRRLQIYALRAAPAAPAIVIGDAVFLTNAEWLELTPETRTDVAKFGFSLESQGLAEAIRNAFQRAESVQPV